MLNWHQKTENASRFIIYEKKLLIFVQFRVETGKLTSYNEASLLKTVGFQFSFYDS